MAEPRFSDDTPGTALFPQFKSQIYEMYTTEVEGLTEGELDFETDRWEWARWSIRRNVSHVASGEFRWLLVRWGEQLFPQGPPPGLGNLDILANSPYDRRLHEGVYWSMNAILGKLKEALYLANTVLSNETVGSLRAKELRIDYSDQWKTFAPAHPRGLRRDPFDASAAYLSLEATLRHRYFEYTTHLYNIQRLKRAQGLPARVKLPLAGYMALPSWDTSEP